MTTAMRMLHLDLFLMTTGHHEASWRLAESDPHASTHVRHYVNLARIAERAAFDTLFLSDGPVLYSDVGRRPCGYLEPLILPTAIAWAPSGSA
jgi:alkanesulfonate monooxygenase SsuD/methylene tetrahydromethanopterin reductase-like flavin-dependent oxidoreductase (luciferase family)